MCLIYPLLLKTNNLKCGIYAEAGNNNRRVDYFLSLGISYRAAAIRNKLLNKQNK